MKSNMKKFLALFLSLSLVLATFGDFAQVKAAESYTDVTLKDTNGWATYVDGDHWVLQLKTSGYTSTDASQTYEGFTYEINGVTKTTSQITSAAGNLLCCTIPTSDVPSDSGTTFTIKAGTYASTSGHEDIRITADFDIVAVDLRLVHTKVIKPDAVEAFAHSANSFHFSLKDADGNGIVTGVEDWVSFLSPSYCDGTIMAQDGWSSTYTNIYIDGTMMAYWDAHFKNTGTGEFYIDGLSAVEGTTVTVKGLFTSAKQADWGILNGHIFLPELTFRYDGSTWSYMPNYVDVTLTGTDGWQTYVDGDHWVLQLKTSGYTSTDASKTYNGFAYEINGVTKTTSQITSKAGNLLYCMIPTSDVPSDSGTTFTIKAGTYASTSGHEDIRITADFDIVAVDFRLVHTKVIKPDVVEAFAHSANSFHFSLKDADGNGIVTGVEDWVSFLSPSYCDGTIMAQADWSSTYTSVYIDGTMMAYWDAHFKNTGAGEFYIDGLSAVEGTTVTVKGLFTSAKQADWGILNGHIFLPELTFTYDGSTWSCVNESEPTYKDYAGTPELQEWNSNKGLYFLGNETFETTEFPYDTGWNIWVYAIDEEESGVFLNGDKTTAYLKKVDSDRWYVDLEAANVVPEDGDEITIIGTFVYETHRITFDEVTFTYETPEAPVTYQGTPVLAPVDNYGNANGFYVYCDDGAPKTDWGTYYYAQEGDTNGVSVQTSSGTTTYKTISLQKNEANMWYIWLGQESNVSLAYGDVVSIEGSFASEAGTVVTFNKASFQYDGKHFSQGTFEATDIEVKDVYYYETTFANNYWNIYFTSSAELPGDANTTYYPHMTCTITDANNETEYVSNWFKTGCTNTIDNVAYTTFLIQIPSEKLPQNLEDEYVITLKAGAAQGRTANSGTENAYGLDTAHTTGIRLTEDFSFVVGDRHEATAPAIDYANTSQTGGGNNNLWVTTKDDFPVTSWTYSLKKADENSGIFLYDSGAKTYTPTDGTMKRHMDGGYYIENFGTVKTGDIILLKGTFSLSNLSFITFGTAKYEWNGSKWIVCSDIDELESTGVDGDARGDSNLNSADLVRMIKFFGDNKAHTISLLDADLNATGDIDEYDIQIERKLLLGLTLYKGVPTYNDNAEMRLAAFVAPKISEGLQKYADAGFTTIIGEQRAVTEATGDDTDATDADNFDAYMKAAESAGLDVLVQSGAITNMITNGATYSGELIRSEFEKASAYKSFRGFFLADEPNYTQLDIINTISTELKNVAEEKDKKMELFMAGHPTYTEVEIWQDSTLSDNAKYYNYADKLGKSLGEYTYDFYPFRNKQKYILGFIPNGRENYMEDGWLLNLKLAARASKNSQGAFDTGFVVQSYSEPVDDMYIRYIGEEEISFQVYSALAYGMKSLNYFTYGKHWDTAKAPTEKCMTLDNDIYDAVKNVNTEIKEFDHVLLNYNWVGTMGVTGLNSDGIMSQMNADGSAAYTSNRISEWSSKNASDATENADAIIGCLKDLNGYDGFMLVNVTDPSDDISENISVTFKETLADGSVLVSTHATVYENGVMKTVPLNDGTLTATLTPGQGIFVIPYIQ